MSEALVTLWRVNLAAAMAVLVVLVLRRPTRRLFGARVAYGLWLLVPLAAAAMLAPARVVTVAEAAPTAEARATTLPAAATTPATIPFDPSPWLLAAWAGGALAFALWLLRRQEQFGRAARAGRAGPAAVGLFRPRIVLPADFEIRYDARERQLILAHEQTHIARGDPPTNALVAAARCAAWFNPLAHVAAHVLRIDQELACDAAVTAAHPGARRAYAEAMLKTQLAARPLPVGCYWPAASAHPLAERISLLGRALPSRGRQAAGAAAVALLALGCAVGAWASRPPEVLVRAAVPETPPPAPPVRPAPRLAMADAVSEPTVAPRPPSTPEVEAPASPPAVHDPAPAEAPAPQLIPASDAFAVRIRGAAERSHVEPGSAVRVLATMTDPDGRRLVTDLTAFGSQSHYRMGSVERDGSRYSLFTSVAQSGDTLYVTASLGSRFAPGTSGTIPLASGQTGTIVLDNGQAVTVTATSRAETPEEIEAGAQVMRKRHLVQVAFTPDPFRCGRRDAVC